MELYILENISYQADLAALRQRLHVQAGSDDDADLVRLAGEAEAVAKPKAMYGLAFIDDKHDDGVTIEGVRFTSRVLRVNLDLARRVFAYVATCGVELGAWAHQMNDMLYQFWAEAIKEAALRAAIKTLNDHINDRYRPGHTSVMNPGSLADWPLREQRPLFRLLGDPTAAIGVQLTESCLMEPNKSVSGIRFPTAESFESCQLCPREVCPGRRAPYDAALYDRKYRQQGGGVS